MVGHIAGSPPRGAVWGPLALSAVLVMASLAVGVSFRDVLAGDLASGPVPIASGWEVWRNVAMSNVLVVALCFSGILSFGLTGLLGGTISSFALGANIGAAWDILSGGDWFRHVALHGWMEVLAVVLATAAGMAPAWSAITGPANGLVGRYAHGVLRGSRLALLACLMVLIGATIEACFGVRS